LGDVRATSGANLASKWKKADRSFQTALGKSKNYYDEVTVDGNCYAVCLKLDALRGGEFELGGPTSPVPGLDRGKKGKKSRPNSRPTSEPGGSRGGSKRGARDHEASPPNSREAFPDVDDNEGIRKTKAIYSQTDPRSKKGRKKKPMSTTTGDMDQGVDPENIERFIKQRNSNFHDNATDGSGDFDADNGTRQHQHQHQHQHQQQHQQVQLESNEQQYSSRVNQMSHAKKVDKFKTPEDYVSDLAAYQSTLGRDGEDAADALKRAGMSKSERDFLQRRGAPAIETNNIMANANTNASVIMEGKPKFPSPVLHQSLDNIPGMGRVSNVGGGGDEVVKAMRERINAMTAEISTLKQKAKGAEEAALHASTRAKEANKKLAAGQQKWVRAMQEKDEEHSREVLQVGSELNEAKATVAELRGKVARIGSEELYGSGAGSIDSSQGGFQQEMLKKVESLHKELSDNQRRWNEEKRRLISEQAEASQKVSAGHRKEINEMRNLHTEMEDKISVLNDSNRNFDKEKNLLNQQLADAERRRELAQLDATKLRGDVKTLQQSLQATQSLDMAQGEMYRDGESTIAALQATSEARIRTLNNKVEYLKAQLASEASLKDQYATNIAELRKEREEANQNFKNKLAELESLKEKELSELSENLRESMDGPIQEVSHLQGKVAALQAQLGDAMQDVAMARKKEEAARGETGKERGRISSLQHELNMTQNELESAREEISVLKENGSNAAANEAMLRRLDNERQYLKNQLTSEVTCKNELQETLERTTRQLGEMKAAWKAESETVGNKLRQEADRRDAVERELETKNKSLEAEVRTQSDQVKELKAAYLKTRDQLRLDQASVENMRATTKRLADELRGAQDELEGARRASMENNARHSENMKTVTMSVTQAEEMRKRETSRLQEETRNALKKASETQREMMILKEKAVKNDILAERSRAAQFVGASLNKWLRGMEARAFATWTRYMFIMRAHEQAGEQITNAIKITEEKAKEEREMACRMVMSKMAGEQAELIEKMEEAGKEDRRKLVKAAQEDINKAVLNERERTTNLMKLGEQKMQRDAEMMAENHKQAVEEMARAHEEHQTAIRGELEKDIERAVFDAERVFLERQQVALRENDARWKEMLAGNEEKFNAEKQQALLMLGSEHDKAMGEHMKSLSVEQQKLVEKCRKDVEKAVKEENARCIMEKNAAIAGVEFAASEKLRAVEEEMARKLEEMRERGELEIKNKRELWMDELEKCKVDWEAELGVKFSEDLREKMSTEKENRQKAVRLEASKWQKALRETEDRIEAERQVSFKKGVAERDAEAQKELSDLKNAANEALDKVKASAKDSLKHALEESASQLRLAREHAARDKEAAIKKGLEQATNEKRKAVEEALALLQKSCDKKKEEALEALTNRERMAKDRLSAEIESISRSWKNDQSELIEVKGLLDQLKVSGKNELANHISAAEEAAVKAREAFEEELKRSLDRQAETLGRVKEDALGVAEKRAEEEKEAAVKAAQAAAEKEMETALGALEAESEKLISSLEQAMGGLRRQKEETERELSDTKGMLEENEDTIYDLQQLQKVKEKTASFRMLQLTAGAVKQRLGFLKDLERKDIEKANEVDYQKEEQKKAAGRFKNEIDVLEGILEACKQQRELMHETLVNHKREVLMEHKVQSGVISRELEAIALEREAVEGQREALDSGLKQMEEQLRDLEEQINFHSKTSTIQGGRVNVSHARKKRRLDEEFEQLLDNIEQKREEIAGVDVKLKELMESKEDSEIKMKELERTLVEVLVEQQKKLLTILSQKPEDVARKMKMEEVRGRAMATSEGNERRRRAKATSEGDERRRRAKATSEGDERSESREDECGARCGAKCGAKRVA